MHDEEVMCALCPKVSFPRCMVFSAAHQAVVWCCVASQSTLIAPSLSLFRITQAFHLKCVDLDERPHSFPPWKCPWHTCTECHNTSTQVRLCLISCVLFAFDVCRRALTVASFSERVVVESLILMLCRLVDSCSVVGTALPRIAGPASPPQSICWARAPSLASRWVLLLLFPVSPAYTA
jgi:hypothetical protein